MSTSTNEIIEEGELITKKAITLKYIAIVCFALFCSVSLISLLSFPFLSIAIIGITFSVSILQKSERNTETKLFFVINCLLSLCILIYANYWVTMLNLIALLWSISISALKGNKKVHHCIFAPFILISRIMVTKSKYQVGIKDILQLIAGKKDLNNKQVIVETTRQAVIGLIISILLMLLIIPLLGDSNIVFRSYYENLFKFLTKALSQLHDLSIWTYRLGAFCIFCFLFPKFFTYNNSVNRETLPEADFSITTVNDKLNLMMLIPKFIISLVLICFFVSQIQLYFADGNYLASLGQSYGKINNEIFGQLLMVASITFLMTFFDKTQNFYHRITSYVLVGLSIFLIFVAGKSDYEYIFHYGFTFKRLWGIVLLFVVLNSFLISVFRIFKNLDINTAFRAVVINALFMLIGVNLINFDRLILFDMPHANSNKERIDYSYSNKLETNVIDVNKLHDYQYRYELSSQGMMSERHSKVVNVDPPKLSKDKSVRADYLKTIEIEYDPRLTVPIDRVVKSLRDKYFEKHNFFDKLFGFNLVEFLAVQNYSVKKPV